MAIPLHEPTFDTSDEAAVLEALRSTWVSTGGPFVTRFEEDFARFVGTRYAVATCNGTAALVLALEVLKRKLNIQGEFEVITPTLSFIATANAVFNTCGVPILVDTAPDSMNVDVNCIRERIHKSYRYDKSSKRWFNSASARPLLAIMPAHIMGYSCDIRSLTDLCIELGIDLIEDAAEALGVFTETSQHLGTFGTAGIFSFNGNKVLTTGGGGMIVTNDANFATRARHLSTTAKTDGLRFIHDEVGFNFRLVNLLAALGCSQLAKLPDALAKKRAIFERYFSNLAKAKNFKVHWEPGVQSNHWIINITFQSRELRERALMALNQREIHARPLWTPAHRLNYFATDASEDFRNAEKIWSTALSVPSSPSLRINELDEICEIIKEAAN